MRQKYNKTKVDKTIFSAHDTPPPHGITFVLKSYAPIALPWSEMEIRVK